MLSDEENYFVLNLKKLALKNSSNNEVFTHIKTLSDLILQVKSFRDQNNRNNCVLNNVTTVKYVNIDTSIKKLRKNILIWKWSVVS